MARSLDDLIPIIKSYFDPTAIAQTDTRAVIAQPTTPSDAGSPWVVGGSFAIGGAALWAAMAKLLEKYGNSALSTREQKVRQELDQTKSISEFYLNEANRDSKTINDTLNLFVAKHLDTTQQMFDLYYLLLEKYKVLEEKSETQEKHIAAMELLLKDMLAVMQMRDRQNKP